MKKLITTLLSLVLGVGMLPLVHANCFKSASLGEYPLGEWSDASRTWVESDTVGSFYDSFATQSALEEHKDTLIAQCSTKGNALKNTVAQRLNQRKANLAAEFDQWCTTEPICSMVRDITIRSGEQEIDQEIGRMQAWYDVRIEKCKGHFNYAFNTLNPRLCE